MKNLNLAKWLSLLLAILFIVTGVVFLFNPIETTLAVVNTLAMIVILIGILKVVRFFSDEFFSTGVFLVGGILDIILGALMLYSQPVSVKTFTIIIGFWELFHGINELAVSIDLKKFKVKGWWLGILAGILGIVFGFMLINDIFLSSVYITITIAIYMFIMGITFISTFLSIRDFQKDMK